MRNNGRVVLVDLDFQLHDSLGIAQPDLLPVNLDRTVRQDVEGLRRFDQSARDPFISIRVDPGFAWIERHRFLTETQREYLGVSLSVGVFAGLDSRPLRRRYDSNECCDDRQDQANCEEGIRRYCTWSKSTPGGDQENMVHTNANQPGGRVPSNRTGSEAMCLFNPPRILVQKPPEIQGVCGMDKHDAVVGRRLTEFRFCKPIGRSTPGVYGMLIGAVGA